MARMRNKRKREKSTNVEPIAKRTRLRTGAPMYRREPVQYPQQWFMPRSRGKCATDDAVIKKRIQLQANDVFNQYCQEIKNLPSTLISVYQGRPQMDPAIQRNINALAYRRKLSARKRAIMRTRSRRRRKARNPYRLRFKPHTRAQKRRRIRVRLPERKKRRGPRKVRRTRTLKDHHRRPAFQQCAPRGHEKDGLFNKNSKKTQRKREELKEQVVEEDQLNVRNICRNLVKDVQGRPADSRDSQPDNAKPGNSKENQHNPKNASKREEEKKRENRRPNRKSGHVATKRRRQHVVRLRKNHRIGKRQRRAADRHVKRSAVYRSRHSAVKLGNRTAPIWRNYNKRSCRSKDVQRKQRANRSAQVERRRRSFE